MPTKTRYKEYYRSTHRCPNCNKFHNDPTTYCQTCLAKRREKSRAITNRPTHVTCQRCQEKFEILPIGMIPKYCPICRGSVNKEHIAQWYQTHRASVRDYGRKRIKRWRQDNPERYLDIRLRKYHITVAQYLTLFTEQKGQCPICHCVLADALSNDTQARKLVSVDHDHQTGKVRGILCSNCNMAIGLLKDNPEIARSAANYLSQTSTAH